MDSMRRIGSRLAAIAWSLGLGLGVIQAAEPEGRCTVDRDGEHLTMRWPTAPGETGRVVLDLADLAPLFERVEVIDDASKRATPLLQNADPATFLVVGTRVNPPPIPPEMSVFNVFFDNPAQRPHQTYRVAWAGSKTSRIENGGDRASVAIGPIQAGPFRGEWVVTVYSGTRLVHVEAVMKTAEENRAINYDTGLIQVDVRNSGSNPLLMGKSLAWIDTQGRWRRQPVSLTESDAFHAVRHRAIVLEGTYGGSVACFPPPHQYFFPRDFTDNLATTWSGQNHRGLASNQFGFGIRQPEIGGGNYSPWFNAPPGTEQRLGVFYLLHPGNAEAAMAEVLRFTHGDRFPELPGFKTFSSHYHIAFTVEAMKRKAQGVEPSIPPLKGVFEGLGVDAVHVAEFHGDGHPFDPGAVRLGELDAMFAECRRLSDDKLLLIPGEEANMDLGFGNRSGHWLEMFPHPVKFTMKRAEGEPFESDGVYRLKTAGDLLGLLHREHGLAWTAHPRIKASNFAPDIYKDAPFFRDPSWLGAAWKAMPADLSRPRLGDRCLDLLDAMSNWGARKQLLGEVDIFKLDSTHELYGHMNVNYVKLAKLPRFDDGWSALSEALRGGQFFTTTGEVLIREAKLDGVDFGSTTHQPPSEIKVDLQWTFPLRFAEVVSGDGSTVHRDRVDLTQTPSFGRQTLTLHPDLKGRKWARFEVWDVAANGAFTQPIWIE